MKMELAHPRDEAGSTRWRLLALLALGLDGSVGAGAYSCGQQSHGRNTSSALAVTAT